MDVIEVANDFSVFGAGQRPGSGSRLAMMSPRHRIEKMRKAGAAAGEGRADLVERRQGVSGLRAAAATRAGRPQTLEDVFMTYTGRSLDEDVEEDEADED